MQSSSWRGCLPRVRAGVRVVMKCWADKKQSRHTRGRLAQAGPLGADLVQLRSTPQPTSRRQPGLEPYTLDQPPAPGGGGGDTAWGSAPPGLATDLAILRCWPGCPLLLGSLVTLVTVHTRSLSRPNWRWCAVRGARSGGGRAGLVPGHWCWAVPPWLHWPQYTGTPATLQQTCLAHGDTATCLSYIGNTGY